MNGPMLERADSRESVRFILLVIRPRPLVGPCIRSTSYWLVMLRLDSVARVGENGAVVTAQALRTVIAAYALATTILREMIRAFMCAPW